MRRLIWVFTGCTSLIVGFVVRWLKYNSILLHSLSGSWQHIFDPKDTKLGKIHLCLMRTRETINHLRVLSGQDLLKHWTLKAIWVNRNLLYQAGWIRRSIQETCARLHIAWRHLPKLYIKQNIEKPKHWSDTFWGPGNKFNIVLTPFWRGATLNGNN